MKKIKSPTFLLIIIGVMWLGLVHSQREELRLGVDAKDAYEGDETSHFELKPQFITTLKNTRILGFGLSVNYAFNDSFSLGIYGEGLKLYTIFDINRIFAVGGDLEFSFFTDFAVQPIVNMRLGYNTERYKGKYSSGFEVDQRIEGVHALLSLGMKTNIERFNNFQFGLLGGWSEYTNKMDIFHDGIGFTQFNIRCIYSF